MHEEPIQSEVVDLTGISLARLGTVEQSALGEALRRVIAEDPSDQVAAFNSSI